MCVEEVAPYNLPKSRALTPFWRQIRLSFSHVKFSTALPLGPSILMRQIYRSRCSMMKVRMRTMALAKCIWWRCLFLRTFRRDGQLWWHKAVDRGRSTGRFGGQCGRGRSESTTCNDGAVLQPTAKWLMCCNIRSPFPLASYLLCASWLQYPMYSAHLSSGRAHTSARTQGVKAVAPQ